MHACGTYGGDVVAAIASSIAIGTGGTSGRGIARPRDLGALQRGLSVLGVLVREQKLSVAAGRSKGLSD